MIKSHGTIIPTEASVPLEHTKVVAHIDMQLHKKLDLVSKYLIQTLFELMEHNGAERNGIGMEWNGAE